MISTLSVAEVSLRARKKQETRDRILESAFALFETQGYEATTLPQIADRAGVAARTLSNYFPLKVDLLVAYRESMLAVVEDNLRHSRGEDGLRRVRAALLAVSRANEAHPNGRLVQRLIARHGSYRALEHIQERFRADLRETLAGDPALRPEVDLDLAVMALSAAFLAVIQHWAEGGSAGLAAQAGRLFEVWAHGVQGVSS